MQQKLNATNHYLYYPDEKDVPPYLAYGFRPIFILLAPYITLSMILWALVFSAVIPLPFVQDPLIWHIHEMLFGVGSAGILAFLFTGLPELYPGTVPIIGKKLKAIIALWIVGRLSFLFLSAISIYLVALLNIALLVVVLAYGFKPVVFDPLRRHISLAYILIALILVELWFYASMASLVSTSAYAILKVALALFMILELLALRRVNMEALNEILEDEGSDETFLAKPPRYNLAIFSIMLFSGVEFFYPDNSALGWLGFAVGAAVLNILNDYRLDNEVMIKKPFVLYLASIFVLMAMGYFFIGYDYLNPSLYGINHFRHFLTTGVFGLSFFLVMVIISTVHTGRHLKASLALHVNVLLLIIATLIRAFIPFYPDYTIAAYGLSTLLWVLPFIYFSVRYTPYLMQKRADGIKG